MTMIDFSEIGKMLEASSNFSLTEKQYKNMTGRDMPKDKSYIERRSALSRYLAKIGYKAIVQEKTISFVKENDK